MLTLTHCTITSDDSTLLEMADATIVINGDTPNSTAQISVPDKSRRKFVRVERVLEAVVKGNGKNWVIQGRSEHLENTVGIPHTESQVTYRIQAAGGCRGCS